MALITCPDCNNQISEFAKQCPFCGRPVVSQESRQKAPTTNYSSPTTTTTTPTTSEPYKKDTAPAVGTQPPINEQELPPKSWVVESILVTCFCCMPLGIAAIMYSTKVETLWYSGDKENALRTSQNAGKWTKIAFFTGITVAVLYIMFLIFVTGLGIYF